MFKYGSLLLLLVALLLSGCTKANGKDLFFENISNLEQTINNDDWELTSKHVHDLGKLYEKNKWKLLLIGDEGEYEYLYESITRLRTSIDVKEKTQSKLELATIRSLLENIYSI